MTGQEARDDEREALIAEARTSIADADRCVALHITPSTGTLHRRLREVTRALADAHTELAARKHPEPEWEYGEAIALGGVWPIKPDISPELWASTPVVRRRKRVAPGPWVPVGEGEK